jgi:integrase
MPANEGTICAYLVTLHEAGKKHATIARAYAAIRTEHARTGMALGTLDKVRNVLSNVARETGRRSAAKAPLMAATLKRIVRGLDGPIIEIRDTAMLLVGFAAAMRRSEIVALDVADLAFTDDGLAVTIRRSKTDQAGEGRVVGVPFGSKGSCPVRAMRAWLEASGIAEGAVFRGITKSGRVTDDRLSDKAVARAVKATVGALGLDPAEYSGHSLRAGLATSAAKAGASLDTIMRTTGHRSEAVARKYIRHGTVFDACASEGLL